MAYEICFGDCEGILYKISNSTTFILQKAVRLIFIECPTVIVRYTVDK